MHFYIFLICINWAAIFPEITAEWEALFPFQTKHGKSCITPCEQRGYSYNWCYIYDGYGKTPHDSYGGFWGRCSPHPGVTIYGEKCNGTCEKHSNLYYFCYTGSNGTWDFCGDTSSSIPSTSVVPQLKTVSGVNCVSPCEETPGYNHWCYKAGGGWDYCSSKPYFDATVSSQLIYTYVGSKCVTPCQPLGKGTNYCYDASTKARLCSRVQGLTVNNEKCHTECDLQGGNSLSPIKIYFWCWTNEAKSAWDYCSHVGDKPTVGHNTRLYSKSRIPQQLTQSNSLENIYSYLDEQGNNRVTFFEQLTRTGNETFYKLENNTQLQRYALECLETWRGNGFKMPTSHDTPISTANAVKLIQQFVYKFQGQEYIQMQLAVNICPGKLETVAEIHAPVSLVGEYPEHVFGAFLRSIFNSYAVHIRTFDYDPSNLKPKVSSKRI